MDTIYGIKILRFIVFFAFCLVLFITGCNKDKASIEELLELDIYIKDYPTIQQFGSHKKSRKKINNINICDTTLAVCDTNEINYTKVLRELGVPLDTYQYLISQIDQIGFRTYYNHEDLSIWVKGGSLGQIHGYLITRNPSKELLGQFRLNDYYVIYPGKMIRDGVYTFTGE